MGTLISRSPEDTLAIGEEWGRQAVSGWVIGLAGDLGAGKTQLVKGIARGLGSRSRVHSPTFALLNQYNDGRFPLFHLDLYRLNGPEQVRSSGLEEYLLNPPGVSVVEWIERWWPDLRPTAPSIARIARLEATTETERRIVYEDFSV